MTRIEPGKVYALSAQALPFLRPAWLENILIQEYRGQALLYQPCWLYQCSLNANGYARVRAYKPNRLPRSGRARLWYLHRWVAFNTISSDMIGKEADHLCFNRNCIQPEHLEVCSHAKNMERRNEMLYGPCTLDMDEVAEALETFGTVF